MAWRVIDDCDLGRIVTHTGGYPGYGSVVMLFPDKGVGLFAFSSKTYGGASLPTLARRTGAAKGRLPHRPEGPAERRPSERLCRRAGGLGEGRHRRRAARQQHADGPRFCERWKTMLAELKAEVGECRGDEPIAPVSAMEGRFDWRCAHGRINGRVQRAPTNAVTLQALEFNIGAP